MGKAVFIAANFAFLVGFGFIANEFGLESQTITFPTSILAPDSSGILDQIIAPFVWAMDAAGTFMQLLAASFTGVGPIIFGFVFGPLLAVDAFIIYGMVRGGGT